MGPLRARLVSNQVRSTELCQPSRSTILLYDNNLSDVNRERVSNFLLPLFLFFICHWYEISFPDIIGQATHIIYILHMFGRMYYTREMVEISILSNDYNCLPILIFYFTNKIRSAARCIGSRSLKCPLFGFRPHGLNSLLYLS